MKSQKCKNCGHKMNWHKRTERELFDSICIFECYGSDDELVVCGCTNPEADK